jgi:hypoxanthine-guanine phosphoribosyltransferase
MKTAQKIIGYIREHKQATGQELTDFIGITSRGVRKQLLTMLKAGILSKKGHPPIVYYQIKIEPERRILKHLSKRTTDLINDNYLYITPIGEKLEGFVGFEAWCKNRELPIEKTAEEYLVILKKFLDCKKNGLIDGLSKLKKTYDQVFLDNLYYMDFYSIDRFGKTKLGQLLLYAKQSQETSLMYELIDTLAPAIEKLIKQKNITSIGFIPPTVKRQIQFMSVLKKRLQLRTRFIKIQKIKSEVVVPQKSLEKLADRIENAKHSIVVNAESKHGNILLIDDAVGSGATLNETAKQIRERGIVGGKIVGLAIVGSYKGFDVISEV